MEISKLDALLRESFSSGQQQQQLRLLPSEVAYIQAHYVRFQVTSSEADAEERRWYDVSLN